MPVFSYKGFDTRGQGGDRRQGRGQPAGAAREPEARRRPHHRGQRGVAARRGRGRRRSGQAAGHRPHRAVQPDRRGSAIWKERETADRGDVAVLTRQLGTLLKAGVPLADSLGALVDQVERAGLKRVLADVKTQVNEGSSLGDAMARHPKVFQDLYVNMVRAGEASGNLDAGPVPPRRLPRGAEQAARQDHLGAVLPDRDDRHRRRHHGHPHGLGRPQGDRRSSPTPARRCRGTRSCSSASPTPCRAGRAWCSSPFIIGGVMLFRRWKRTPRGRAAVDRIILKLWVVGPLARKIAITRFAKTLSTMLAVGRAALARARHRQVDPRQHRAAEGDRGRQGVDPGGRVDRRAAQALGRVPAHRHAHDLPSVSARASSSRCWRRWRAPTTSRST